MLQCWRGWMGNDAGKERRLQNGKQVRRNNNNSVPAANAVLSGSLRRSLFCLGTQITVAFNVVSLVLLVCGVNRLIWMYPAVKQNWWLAWGTKIIAKYGNHIEANGCLRYLHVWPGWERKGLDGEFFLGLGQKIRQALQTGMHTFQVPLTLLER